MTDADKRTEINPHPRYFDVLPIHPSPLPFESFTGYLIRIADINRIDSQRVLSVLLYPDGRGNPISRVNSISDFPQFDLGNVPIATNCSDLALHGTTLHHIGRKFGRIGPSAVSALLSRGVSNTRRYCPSCLTEQRYYRLDWQLLLLDGCPKHSRFLLGSCGHCGAKIPLIPPLLKIGICPRCNGDLGTCESPLLSENETVRAREISSILSPLLLPGTEEMESLDADKRIGRILTKLRREKGLTREQAASMIGAKYLDILHIEEGIRYYGGRSLANYLAYAELLDISIHELLARACNKPLETLDEDKEGWADEDAYDQPKSGQTDLKPRRDLERIDRDLRSAELLRQVEQAVQELRENGEAVSLAKVGMLIEIPPARLRTFPALRQRIDAIDAEARISRGRRIRKRFHA